MKSPRCANCGDELGHYLDAFSPDCPLCWSLRDAVRFAQRRRLNALAQRLRHELKALQRYRPELDRHVKP